MIWIQLPLKRLLKAACVFLSYKGLPLQPSIGAEAGRLTFEPQLLLRGLLVEFTYSLHCSSFLGLPFRIHNIKMVKPKN